MNSVLNTQNSKTRDHALNTIIDNMNKTSSYVPFAYNLDGSNCSCCLSEYFYLVCKINSDYKILMYDGYINHTSNCAGIRCTCGEPFIWKNINPSIITFTESELEYFLETTMSIRDDEWKDDYKSFLEQQKQCESMQKYNENDDTNADEPLKNYSYYFK